MSAAPIASRVKTAIGGLVCAAICAPCLAQQGGPLSQLGLKQTDAAVPGVGRVLLALAFTLAAAVAVVYAIRRFGPAPLRQRSGSARVSAQLAVSTSLKLHFVDFENATLVVAEGRGGIAIAQLEKQPSGSGGTEGAGNAH